MNTISREIYDTTVEQLYSNGYINLLQLALCKNRNLYDYLEDEATKKFLDYIAQFLQLSMNELILEGIWGHPYVAIDFGRWCDRYLAIFVHKWFLEWNNAYSDPIAYNKRQRIYLSQYGVNRLGLLQSGIEYFDVDSLQRDWQTTRNMGSQWYLASYKNDIGTQTKIPLEHQDIYSIVLAPQKNKQKRLSSACFIVTACDADKYTLDIFYGFRDRVLLKNRLGKNLVRFYYKHSPPVAKTIKKSPLAKKIILKLLIKPLAYLLGRFAL